MNETTNVNEKKKAFFQQFIDEYVQYSKDGSPPASAGQDVKYALQLQAERAKNLGYAIEYDIEPGDLLVTDGRYERHWKDGVYDNYQQFCSCKFTKTIYKDGKKVYHRKQNEIFYEIVTDYRNPRQMGEELYSCPGCGGVVKIKELEEGCPYCGSHFQMSELFPKVTNYFKAVDFTKTGRDLKIEIGTLMLLSILLVSIYVFFFVDLNTAALLGRVIKSILIGILPGALLGYFLWAGKTIGKSFIEAGRSLGPLFSILGSRGRFTSYMKRYSPDFSYEYFTSKVCSLFQTIIFSEDAAGIPFYQGEDPGDLFGTILESNMFGRPGLKSFRVEGDRVFLKVKVYMDNTCATEKGVKFARDVYYLDLYRNVAKPLNYNFSIHRISCKSCGGSFDAGRHADCPFCGTRYPLEEEEWIITKIRKA